MNINRSDLGASKRVLDYIIQFKVHYDGLSPTYRQIMAGCGLKSASTVGYHLERLLDGGFIDRPLRGRGIMVVGGEWIPPSYA